VAARLLIAHHRLPDAIGVEVVAGIVQQGSGLSVQQTRREALANETALPVAAVGVESIANYGLPPRTTSVTTATSEQVIFEKSI
jgi:hypothetical protein